MPRMPTYAEIRADFERGVRAAEQRVEHPLRRAANQHPAPVPGTMAAAPAAAPTKENRMSLATLEADLGQRIAAAEAAVHDEIGKLVGDLPVITADARKLAGNPIAAVAIRAAEHLAAGIIPPEALTYLAGTFGAALDGMVSWYGQPAPAQPAPAQPAAPQPAAPAQ